MIISDTELTAAMEAAVDANHRRAVQEAQGSQEAPKGDATPMWACLIWLVIMAALVAACVVYSMV